MQGEIIGVYGSLEDVRNELLDRIYSQVVDAVRVNFRPLAQGTIYQAAEYQVDFSKIDFEAVLLVISDFQNDVYQLRELDKG